MAEDIDRTAEFVYLYMKDEDGGHRRREALRKAEDPDYTPGPPRFFFKEELCEVGDIPLRDWRALKHALYRLGCPLKYVSHVGFCLGEGAEVGTCAEHLARVTRGLASALRADIAAMLQADNCTEADIAAYLLGAGWSARAFMEVCKLLGVPALPSAVEEALLLGTGSPQ